MPGVGWPSPDRARPIQHYPWPRSAQKSVETGHTCKNCAIYGNAGSLSPIVLGTFYLRGDALLDKCRGDHPNGAIVA